LTISSRSRGRGAEVPGARDGRAPRDGRGALMRFRLPWFLSAEPTTPFRNPLSYIFEFITDETAEKLHRLARLVSLMHWRVRRQRGGLRLSPGRRGEPRRSGGIRCLEGSGASAIGAAGGAVATPIIVTPSRNELIPYEAAESFTAARVSFWWWRLHCEGRLRVLSP
jgi:hypothetical protein